MKIVKTGDKKLKVLFIYPEMAEHGNIPIALTILTAVLRKAGHSVTIFDCSVYVPKNDLVKAFEEIGMFKVAPPLSIPRPVSKCIENMEEDLIKIVKACDAKLIGITTNTGTFSLGLKCSKILKKHFPSIYIIFGGIHPTICPDEVIREPSVDMICIGEGEDALLEICDTFDNDINKIKSIKNIWFKDKSNPELIYKNPLRDLIELDSLPPQDFSDFNEYDFYRPLDGKMYKMMYTEISRGCIFNCSYCANHVLKNIFKKCGPYHRRKSPEKTIEQLKYLKDKYKFEMIRFWDEDFTVFSIGYLKKLAELYKREIQLPFLIYAGTRTISEDKVSVLKDMNCVTIAMAIESGNEWMRKYILNRNISDDDIIRKYDIVKKSGIRVSAYNMIGLPFETREMIFETIHLNRKINPATSSVSIFKPYPKTRLYEIVKDFGFLKSQPQYLIEKSDIDSPFIKNEEINGLQRTFALYTKVREKEFPLLKKCEKDEELAKEVFPNMIKSLAVDRIRN